MSAETTFAAVQLAVAGEPVKDAWAALTDSMALCIGYAADDAAHAERLIGLIAADLREGLVRYAAEIAEGRATCRPAGQA